MGQRKPRDGDPLLLDLDHPRPLLRGMMRALGLCGLVAIGIGLWGLAELLVTGGLLPVTTASVEPLRLAARWAIGGLLMAAVGFWDR